MTRVKLIAQRHARYVRGDVFKATDAEMESFGDKFEIVGEGLPPDDDELSLSAGAIVLCERFEVDPLQVDGTGPSGQITADNVMDYIALRDVAVIKGDGKEVIRTPGGGDVHATRSALDLARECDVDIDDVTGTGRDGRIILNDVRDYLKSTASTPSEVEQDDVVVEPAGPLDDSEEDNADVEWFGT